MAHIDTELTKIHDIDAGHGGLLAGRKKFMIGGIIIIAAIVFLVMMGFRSSQMFYLTPGELQAKAPTLYGEDVRLAGTIDKRSVEWSPENMTLKFDVFEGRDVVPVVYEGPKPDTFDLAEGVTVEGVYHRDGVFEARNLLLQCPSKYEAKLEESSK